MYKRLKRICTLMYEKSAAILLKPSPPNTNHVENRGKLQALVFNIVYWVGGEVRQAKLHSHLACVQKRQNCNNYCQRLLSMIVTILKSLHQLSTENNFSLTPIFWSYSIDKFESFCITKSYCTSCIPYTCGG